ncbi:MAG: efflux RND transporter periplasmic adaptor subunit [Hyphomonadaceae bacterium]|nr:efflux RND transporter periplasmic adaptor subunit [Hyphomonadaceae bacterium]MBX3510352.1 efflux RND transporter periplasmic adaptor subunit [Hyphomonadaceae bacterium]
MNKPEPRQIFSGAQGLLKRTADAGGAALRNAQDAGGRVWRKATGEPDEAGHRSRVLTIFGGGILAVVAALFILSRLGGETATHTPVDTAQAVTVVVTQTRTVQPVVTLNGEARPVRDIQVAAPASGVRILQLLVDEGDMVRAGQPMARLDSSLAQAQLRAAQASVAEAQSAAVRARGEYDRAESIRDSGALSAEAIEQRRTAAIAADARLAAARAQLQEVNARLGGGFVRAPAAGLVIDRTAEVGRLVDGQVLFRIAADNRLEVAAQVAESDALALQDGQTASFVLVDGSSVDGVLRRAPASIDSRTRTGEALFSLPQGTRVRAGMYLRGRVELPAREVLAIPQSSVLFEGDQAFVYRLDQENQARRTQVTLGVRDGDWVEIASGLELNQRIVGSGAAFLQDGERVRPITAEQPSTAEPSADLRGREG